MNLRASLMLSVICLCAHACSNDPSKSGAMDAAGQFEAGMPAVVEVPDFDPETGDLLSDRPDGPKGVETISSVPCPTSGDLRQNEQKAMQGKVCAAEDERCGNDGYCNCYFWCDCKDGVWACDSICDDSCWGDTHS